MQCQKTLFVVMQIVNHLIQKVISRVEEKQFYKIVKQDGENYLRKTCQFLIEKDWLPDNLINPSDHSYNRSNYIQLESPFKKQEKKYIKIKRVQKKEKNSIIIKQNKVRKGVIMEQKKKIKQNQCIPLPSQPEDPFDNYMDQRRNSFLQKKNRIQALTRLFKINPFPFLKLKPQTPRIEQYTTNYDGQPIRIKKYFKNKQNKKSKQSINLKQNNKNLQENQLLEKIQLRYRIINSDENRTSDHYELVQINKDTDTQKNIFIQRDLNLIPQNNFIKCNYPHQSKDIQIINRKVPILQKIKDKKDKIENKTYRKNQSCQRQDKIKQLSCENIKWAFKI